MSQIVVRSSKPTPVTEYLRPGALVGALRARRELIGQFASRDILERHRGAYLGFGWNFVSPLVTLAIYSFVFGYVFKSRWQHPDALAAAEAAARGAVGGEAAQAASATVSFVLPFFLGHALFHFFAECVNRAPGVVASRPNLVKKVVFPLEILPVVSLIGASVYTLVCIPALLIVQWVLTRELHATALLLPVVAVPLVLMAMAASWLLSALGAYIRDLRHVAMVFTQLLMFMTPVFYSVERIPEQWRWAYGLNPLAIVIESARDVVIWGRMPDWGRLGILTAAAAVGVQVSYAVFMRARRGFADVV